VPEDQKDVVQEFTTQLFVVLKKYCTVSVLQELRVTLDELRALDISLLEVEKKNNQPINEHGLIEQSHLQNIITYCQEQLSKQDGFDLVLDIADLCVAFSEHSTANALYANIIALWNTGKSYRVFAAQALHKRAELRIKEAQWEDAFADLSISRREFFRTKNNLGIAKTDNTLGIFYAEQGEMKKSIKHFKRSASLFETLGKVDLSSAAYMNLGILAIMHGKFDEAFVNFQRALPEFEQQGDFARLAEIHHNIGMLSLAKEDYKSAMKEFDESLEYSAKAKYESLWGLSYLGKAALFTKTKDFPLASVLNYKALEIFRKLNDQLSVADCYKVKGTIQREMKKFDIADLYLRTSIRLNELYKNPLNLGETYFEYALLQKEQGKIREAKSAFKESSKYFKQIDSTQNLLKTKEQLKHLK
jgi:tetratricopeptide (TPR) repeat protein